MRGVIHFCQVLPVQMGIDLRCRYACVAQHFLHRAQVAAGLQYVGGKRVTQHVWVYVLRQTLFA